MTELNVPDFAEEPAEPTLTVENLEFHSGDKNFSKEDFIEAIQPYFADLKRMGRTNFLCAFAYGNDEKTDVTGYRSDTTINVTNNTNILKSKSTEGRWVVYRLNN